MTVSQSFRHLLTPTGPVSRTPISDLNRNFERTKDAVRIFYLLSTLFAAVQLYPIH